ncbi:MAG: o-succinylbenzoate--CoA ligase, partial [Candidatus Zixiibacteriota bacterium]
PIPGPLLHMARQRGLPVFTTYGLTEMASQVTTTRRDDSPGEITTAGRLLPYREVSTALDGEILVKGATLFRGYVEGDRVALPLDNDGWFHTGDVGRIDADGCLTVLGRKDNMFISGGENIFPEEIESALLGFTEIVEAVIVPLDDAEFGRRPVAFVRFGEGKRLSKSELLLEMQTKLPRFKLPVYFYEWPEDMYDEGAKPARTAFRQLITDGKAKPIT